MEKLIYKCEMAFKAAQAVELAIGLHNRRYNQAEEDEQATYDASVVKHFELFYETLWKYLRFFLKEKHGITTLGSKDVFRATKAQGLINNDQLHMLLDTVDIHNATTHVYDKDYARELCKDIKQVVPAMIRVLEATKS